MKRWTSFVVAIVALAVMPVVATASEGQSQEGQNDGQNEDQGQGQGQGTIHYGPFNGSSADSGTCGKTDWANDTFKRVFEASSTPNANGTYSATEFFNDGAFVTLASNSPGACNIPNTNNGGLIRAGVTGSMHGIFGIVVTGGTFNPNAVCNQTTCDTTAKWVHTVYGATSTYDTPVFEFTYHAGGQGLIEHMWHNASLDRGGNYGDIRSS